MSRLFGLSLQLLLSASFAAATGAGYVDSIACRSCHREIYDQYSATPMSRSFYTAANAPLMEDWDRNNRFYHQASNRHYEMIRRDGRLFVGRYQQDEQGRRTNALELPVTHIMGSGVRARSYLHRTAEGRFVELPVSWYSQERRWAMAPGYDRPKHPDFSRTVNHKCMFCHNAYPDVPAERARQGWDWDVRFPENIPLGIDCQRCHGPGEKHARDASVRSIVNPSRLPPDRQLDICMQCHLETTTFRLPDSYRRFGRGFYSYRPGEPLADYIVHFDHAPGSGHDDKFEIVSAAYRLRKSSCFLKSQGRLVCTTCHDAHGTVSPERRASHYREKCLQCHSSAAASKHDMDAATFGRGDCLSCHMPMRRTEDVVLVAMTDHRIVRTLPAGDLLAPRREKTDAEQHYSGPVVSYYPRLSASDSSHDLYLGIAQVKEKANLESGVELLKRALRLTGSRAAEPYFELAEAQLALQPSGAWSTLKSNFRHFSQAPRSALPGDYLRALGLKEEARGNYLEALRRDPAFVHAESNVARLLAAMGRPAEAIRHYRRAVELDPDSADLHTNLGLTLMEAGDLTSAGRSFQNAVAADSLYAPAWRDYGSFLLSQGQVEPARMHLARALVLDPSDAKSHNNLGLALVALGRRSEALSHFKSALRYGDQATRDRTRAALKRLDIELPE